MRKPFIEQLEHLMDKDKTVILLLGDVGFSFLEPLMKKYPKRVINVGIAEQNMMGMAAGLSNVGMKPYVYTMKNFILLRPHEQLRNDIGFANANVKLFGVGGSEAYRFLGMSHNLFPNEEQDILKHIPNTNAYFPQTEQETKELILKEYQRNGPAYFSI